MNNNLEENIFNRDLVRVKHNDPRTTKLSGKGDYEFIQNMTEDEWEQLGRDIANNSHLVDLYLQCGALNDERLLLFFRGLTHSTIKRMYFCYNELSSKAMSSMLPFLLHTRTLHCLDLDGNDIESDGFNCLLGALLDTPVVKLSCNGCDIESIDGNLDLPRNLEYYSIDDNACEWIAKFLQGGDPTLKYLYWANNMIHDEGIATIADALQNNTTLLYLNLSYNFNSIDGRITLLKLVNDISSVRSTLQTNCTLKILEVEGEEFGVEVSQYINMSIKINHEMDHRPEKVGRMKIIQTQLHGSTRAALAKFQGVDHSIFSEINPLHLPEVLALVGLHHGQKELYSALKSSIAGVISIVNRRKCIKQRRDYYAAKVEQLDAELATIDSAAAVDEAKKGCGDFRVIKRRRK